jgi:small neutral amino acid transporter SnatA (MarC family)
MPDPSSRSVQHPANVRIAPHPGINLATRLMALIPASVGINFIVSGLKNQFPGLAR